MLIIACDHKNSSPSKSPDNKLPSIDAMHKTAMSFDCQENCIPSSLKQIRSYNTFQEIGPGYGYFI